MVKEKVTWPQDVELNHELCSQVLNKCFKSISNVIKQFALENS